jgi:hypothetical protein
MLDQGSKNHFAAWFWLHLDFLSAMEKSFGESKSATTLYKIPMLPNMLIPQSRKQSGKVPTNHDAVNLLKALL